jgi:zinc D-Ala-D-Ala carboxypeptidase
MGILKKIKDFVISTQIITIDDLETKNFKKEEWFKTNTGLDNTPKLGILTCLLYTSKKINLCNDALLKKYKAKIKLNSAYRSPAVNKKVKGSPSSKHMQGLASDIDIIDENQKEMAPKDGAKLLMDILSENKISFDKILIERGCIHIQFNLDEKKDDKSFEFAELINGEWVTTNVELINNKWVIKNA